MKLAYVYIMANRYRGTTYIDVTSSLPHRAIQHRDHEGSTFAAKYGCDLLVYIEEHQDAASAIAREKSLKKWNRAWKVRLIEEQNPDWRDMFDDLLK